MATSITPPDYVVQVQGSQSAEVPAQNSQSAHATTQRSVEAHRHSPDGPSMAPHPDVVGVESRAQEANSGDPNYKSASKEQGSNSAEQGRPLGL